MAIARPLARTIQATARPAGQLIAFPGAASPSAKTEPTPTVLTTSLGVVSIRQPDPSSIVATADLDAGVFAAGETPLGVRAPFVYSESSEAFVIAFTSDPICWVASGKLAHIDLAYAAVEAIQDALAVLVHEQPRILAVARVETMSARLKRLDAEIGVSSDASRMRMREGLAAELVAARRALLVDARSLDVA